MLGITFAAEQVVWITESREVWAAPIQGFNGPQFHLKMKVPLPNRALKVATNGARCVVLDDVGKVWVVPGWPTAPEFFDELPRISDVSAGGGLAYALDHEGRVWDLSISATLSGLLRKPPLSAVCLRHAATIKRGTDGNTFLWRVKSLRNLASISVGRNHTLALDIKGRVWGFGEMWNCMSAGIGLGKFKIGQPLLLTWEGRGPGRLVAVKAGENWSLGLTAQGQLVTWGTEWDGDRNHLGRKIFRFPLINRETVVAIAANGEGGFAQSASGDVYRLLVESRNPLFKLKDSPLVKLNPTVAHENLALFAPGTDSPGPAEMVRASQRYINAQQLGL